MKSNPESARVPWRDLTVNLAGLSDNQLAEVSPIIGGSQREVVADMPDDLLEARTVILPWGDERLTSLLTDVTAESGYPYGAERLHIVATTEARAIWFLVVPKIPYDIDDARDEAGEIDGEQLALMDPAMDPNAIFYEWSEEGAHQVEFYHQFAEPPSRLWIDAGDYLLGFEMSVSF